MKFPYPKDARLDSLVESRNAVTYYYSQEVKTDETSKKMLITLQGQVLAVDDSAYRLPPSDTLSYIVSSMLSFVDTMPHYRIKVIDKYVTVQDRNYIQFFVGDTRVVDTLGDNRRQLDKITNLMRQIVEQEEFFVDTITLTAASSPEGRYAFNDQLSRGRAEALKQYLVKRYGRGIDILLTVRWIAEDWSELTQRIRTDKSIENREAILVIIASEKNPDRREQAIRAALPERLCLYPLDDLSAASGRTLPLQPAPQGNGQGHDPYYGIGYDLYAGSRIVAETQICPGRYIFSTTITTATRSWRISRWITTSGRWNYWP